jgi:uncharacterized protein YndB with AHSA1/START domain
MNSKAGSKDSVNLEFNVPASADRAFKVFVHEINTWWPREYTWAGEVLEKIEIETRIQGRCFERGPHGFECDWGRVTAFDSPNRIVFTWQIAPDRVPEPNPDKASEVEVSFSEIGKQETRVKFEHRNFEKHGEHAESYKQALSSPQGWKYILDKFKDSVFVK